MRILFLCGSLEPGRDGVGDYTRRLACELIRQGEETAVIALNDQHLKNVVKEVYDFEKIDLPVLRIPSVLDMRQRFEIAEQWTNEFNPDWISLQFVPFAFHPKGLTYSQTSFFKALGRGRKWHILFHELWLGMHAGASKKESLWGYVQRRMIISLVRKLNPKQIHTQSSLYKKKLADANIEASVLPLFSNIPVYQQNENQIENNKHLVFVLFGEIHNTGAPVNEFAKELKTLADKKGLNCSLVLLGRCGKEQETWKSIWESQGMVVKSLGEMPIEQISIQLQKANFGITTTVYGKVEKSGSVAAMLEHQLPILCVAGPWKPKGMKELNKIPGITEYKIGQLETLFNRPHEENTFCKIEEAASRLTNSLKQSQNNK